MLCWCRNCQRWHSALAQSVLIWRAMLSTLAETILTRFVSDTCPLRRRSFRTSRPSWAGNTDGFLNRGSADARLRSDGIDVKVTDATATDLAAEMMRNAAI